MASPTGIRRTCRSKPLSTISNASPTASSWRVSICLRSARARRSRSRSRFAIPDRVGGRSIFNGYAAGWATRGDPAELARREAMLTLTQTGWGADNPAYRQLFTNLYVPGASPQQTGWFTESSALGIAGERLRLQRVLAAIDVRPLLSQVQTPTLIFHSRDDQAVPFAQGEELAAAIPGAASCRSKAATTSCSQPNRRGRCSRSRAAISCDSGECWRRRSRRRQARRASTRAFCTGSDGARLAYAVTGRGFRW